MNSVNPDIVPIIRQHITSRLIGDEAFLMNLETLDTYILNDTAARVWQCIDGSHTAGDIIRTLQSEYDVDAAACEAAVSRLLREFADAGLIGLDGHG